MRRLAGEIAAAVAGAFSAEAAELGAETIASGRRGARLSEKV